MACLKRKDFKLITQPSSISGHLTACVITHSSPLSPDIPVVLWMQTSPCRVSVSKMMLTLEVWYLSIWYRLQKPDVWVSDADFCKSDIWVSDTDFRSLMSEYLMQYLFQKSDVWVLSNYRTERYSVVCVESDYRPLLNTIETMFQSSRHDDDDELMLNVLRCHLT